MQGAGLGMLLAHMRNRKPTKKCTRCGLRHSIAEDNCPHCYGLNDAELASLKARVAKEAEGNSNLGRMMLFGAVGLLVFVLLLSL